MLVRTKAIVFQFEEPIGVVERFQRSRSVSENSSLVLLNSLEK
jgi:hypothetical protein